MTLPNPGELPDLPAPTPAHELQQRSDNALITFADDLTQRERAIRLAMAPFDKRLAELRTRLAEVATEQRRRVRAGQMAARRAVREGASTGTLPSLADALSDALSSAPADAATDGPADIARANALDDAPPRGGAGYADDRPFAEIPAFLRSGGAVGFGYPSRPGAVGFTDGRQHRMVSTWGAAKELHQAGWEVGAPAVPGVRVHLQGTRVERVVSPNDVILGKPDATSVDASQAESQAER